jgi:hypothetical protein
MGRHTFQRVLEALVIIAIVVTVAFGVALATGNGGPLGGDPVLGARGGKPSRSNATLVVTPNPAAAGGAVYTVSGSGYGAGQMVAIALANPGCCVSWNVLSDAAGNISFQRTTGGPGTYYVYAYKYGKGTLLASTSFTVQ